MKPLFWSLITICFCFFSCSTSDETNKGSGNTVDVAVTGNVMEIGATFVQIEGFINLNLVTSSYTNQQIGIEYSDNEDFKNAKRAVTRELEGNKIKIEIKELDVLTTYFYRSFVQINNLSYYGEKRSFTTKDFSNITSTGDAFALTYTSANIYCNIDIASLDFRNPFSIGVIYSISKNCLHPDSLASSSLYYGTVYDAKSSINNIANNVFCVSLSKLQSGTTYYYCSYTKMGSKYKLGEIKNFTTLSYDSNNGNLDTPKYESSSARYNITDANSNYQSVEFTASGNYIITMKSGVKAPRRIAALKKVQFGFIPQRTGMTRNVVDNNIIFGTYIKNGDTYVLEGFGTIVVNGGGSSAVLLDITTNSGTKVTVGAQQQQQYPSSTKTNMLCRTWNLGKIKLVQTVNGQTIADKTFNSYPDLVRTLLEAEGLNPGDQWYDEAYKEMIEEEPKQVIFTKSGTYVVSYSNGTLAVSTWKWTDEAKGEARYSWDYSSIDNPNESGKINISFVGSQLLISEYIDAEEEGVNVSVAIQYYLSEAK